MIPLRIKSSAVPADSSNIQGLQEMTDAEIEQYISATITKAFSDASDAGAASEPPGSTKLAAGPGPILPQSPTCFGVHLQCFNNSISSLKNTNMFADPLIIHKLSIATSQNSCTQNSCNHFGASRGNVNAVIWEEKSNVYK